MSLDTTAVSRARPPGLIPGYTLEKLVGKGGMGEVHKAIQLSLGRTVAVKLLAPELAKDPNFVARFEKEAAALATLSHPHVVSIVDKGNREGTYYLVMEFVDGPSLREVMRSPLMTPQEGLKIAYEICRAIDYAHSKGVIHRDLKPENILFDEQAGGIPKVTDFGLAAFSEGAGQPAFNVTETHVSMGTLSYMAPEQRVDARSADHRADIYSLGVILYELLTGELPVGNYDPPSQKKAGLDKRVDQVIARCLRPIPSDRYAKMTELLADLEPVVPLSFSQGPRKLSKVDRAKLAAARLARRVLKIAAVAVVVAATTVLLLSFLRNRKGTIKGPLGAPVAAELLEAKGTALVEGRLEGPAHDRRLSLGEGPDEVQLLSFGRGLKQDSGALFFEEQPPTTSLPARAVPNLEMDGHSAAAAVDAHVEAPASGALATLRALFFGPVPEPRAVLALQGSPGRYAAVILTGSGAPVTFEWSLGDRRGTMSIPNIRKANASRLELSVDPEGELRAFIGAGRDRRPVGEPVSLGSSWKKVFGGMPKPSIGCYGECRFQKLGFEVKSPLPPEPAPPPPVVSVVAKKPAARATTTRATSGPRSRTTVRKAVTKKQVAPRRR